MNGAGHLGEEHIDRCPQALGGQLRVRLDHLPESATLICREVCRSFPCYPSVRAAVVTEIHSVTVSSKENQRQFVFAVCRPTRAPRGKHAPWRCGISQPEPVESEPTPPDTSTACALILCLAVGDGVSLRVACVSVQHPVPEVPRAGARQRCWHAPSAETDGALTTLSWTRLLQFWCEETTHTDDTSTTRTRIERAPRPPVRPRLLHLVR